jgi:Glycosyl transferase family 2
VGVVASTAPAEGREVLVDVGIPVRGRVRYIAEAIESVVAQSASYWRLTISEDGPGSAKVEAVVRPYLRDPRIRHVTTNQRVGAALNHSLLIQAASAPYVALLHDDDRWEPHFLERRVSFLERHDECGLVFSPVSFIDKDGRATERSLAELPEGCHSSERVVSIMLDHNPVPFPSVLVRRSAYEAVGCAFDDRFKRLYDYEMWLRLAVRFAVGYLTTCDSCWRVHGDQSTHSVENRRREFALLLEQANVGVREYLPQLRPTGMQTRRVLAGWTLTNALDAVEQGRRGVALRELAAALHTYPLASFDVRTPAMLASLVFGRSGSRSLHRVRQVVRRHQVDVHPMRALRRQAVWRRLSSLVGNGTQSRGATRR